MSYEQWLHDHAAKHADIIKKLQAKNFTKQQIVEYFDYENICLKEPDFCILYKKKQKCHDIEQLNCYFCGCPHFRFYTAAQDNIYSYCAIDSPKGAKICYKNEQHQDCSNCIIPHKRSYVLQFYTPNWLKKMSLCRNET